MRVLLHMSVLTEYECLRRCFDDALLSYCVLSSMRACVLTCVLFVCALMFVLTCVLSNFCYCCRL